MKGNLDKYSGGKQPTSSRLRKFSLGFGNSLAKWDKRYFVLAEGSSMLAYHKNAEDADAASKPALGTMPCEGSIVACDAEDGTIISLAQVGEQPRVLWLRAESPELAGQWVAAIKAAGAVEQATDGAAQMLKGMLLKQVDGKPSKTPKFDKRYFRLSEGIFAYFKAESDMSPNSKKPPLGSFTVGPAVRVDLLPAPKPGEPRCTFAVSNGDSSTYTLKVRACSLSSPRALSLQPAHCLCSPRTVSAAHAPTHATLQGLTTPL